MPEPSTGISLRRLAHDSRKSHLSNWHTFIGHLDHMVRPVLYATFLIDHSLYGPDPAGYHLLNLLLHLGAGV
jgi:hypothetical protein